MPNKYKKMKVDPLETLKKFAKGRKHKKMVKAETRTHASQTSKNPDKPLCQVAVEVTNLVWQLVEATAYIAYNLSPRWS